MPRAINGKKECSKCHEVKPATSAQFPPDKQCLDGFSSWCRVCSRAARTRWDKTEKGHASNRAHIARYQKTEKGRARHRVTTARYQKSEKGLAIHRASARRIYQRKGRGVHKARIQDWREFFDSLASDAERCVAAHVLLVLAGINDTAKKVVKDPDFDYNYLAEHFDIA